METYDKILKWDDDRVGCLSCYGLNHEKKECEQWISEVNAKSPRALGVCKYYANKDQLEALIKEWDERYKRDGGLFICNESDGCLKKNGACSHKIPYIYSSACSGKCKYSDKEGECVPYRGDNEMDKSNNASEYIVVKSFDLETLSKTDIASDVFIGIYRAWPSLRELVGWTISEGTIFTKKAIDELIRLGFIKNEAYDPIVKFGDTFIGPHGLYIVIRKPLSKQPILTDMHGDYYDSNPNGEKLSDIIGVEDITKFKPCKIKIEVIE